MHVAVAHDPKVHKLLYISYGNAQRQTKLEAPLMCSGEFH